MRLHFRLEEHEAAHYATRGLLCIDDIGYLSYDARAADLLFQVVSRRYERKSLVLTTNLPFSDWPTIFPNASTATALIDRLVHHAEILAIEGDSYRRRVAEAKRKSPVALGELSRSPVAIPALSHVAQHLRVARKNS